MIYIDRARTDDEGQKIAPDITWYEKAEEATTSAISDPENHEFERQIYGAEVVRAALEELFYRKCAYCEGPLPESEWDVEHLRPKGRVAENKYHPGYYWLAYVWENLYPSCKPCNQRRKDKPVWGDLTYGITGGKADQFPLGGESNRAMKPEDDVTIEDNLFFDPCADEPEKHILYFLYGEIEGKDQYGKATIRICNLTRRRLEKARENLIREITELLRLMRDAANAGHEQVSARLRIFMRDNYLHNRCHFAGVARFVTNNPEKFDL